MGQERVTAAIARLERVYDRIEAAVKANARGPSPYQDARIAREAEELRSAHRLLRGRVEGAIRQIDRLLETEQA